VLDGHLGDDRETRYLCELERYAVRHADRFLWPGGGVLAAYRAYYRDAIAPPQEVAHVMTPDPAPAEQPREGDRLRFLYVGRLERRKGVQNLVRAATALGGSDWSLTLVGGDTATAPLGQSMREQLELMIAGDERIRLRDRLPREKLRGLLAAADVCVSPSLWECWPSTVLEAFEQNRPVLATPVGGHVGMVEPERSGWLAPGTDDEAIAGALERILADRDAPARLAREGGPRARFERLTDPEPVRERYLALAAERRDRAAAATRPSARPPLVSIVVPYYRMEEFVDEALESIAAQTYPRVDTIIVNDGSLRRADAILDRLAERHPVRIVTQPNSGLGRARNLGIALSPGEYVLPFDPDDLLLPAFVERCVDVLERRPELAYVTAWSEYVDAAGAPLDGAGYRPLGNTASDLERENVAGSAMAVLRRHLFDHGLRYSAELTSYEDWLLYRELAADGRYGHVIPEVLLRYRVRRRSMLRAIARPSHDRLMGELRAHARESEVAWTPSSG
jgi:hypothetical protein